ncbi:MAG: glycosyltransferase family 39 protein [Fuerstiella sp.]
MTATWKLALAAVWLVGFLWLFFTQLLPNNSTNENPISRLNIWAAIISDPLSLLNPLDYSWSNPRAAWSNFSQRIPHLSTAVMIWLSAWGIGAFGRHVLLSKTSLRRSECLVIDGGVGLSSLSLLVLFCGVLGSFNKTILLAPGYILGCVFMGMAFRRKVAGHRHAIGTSPAANLDAESEKQFSLPFGIVDWMLCVGIAMFGLHMFLGTFTPAFDFDVREYHLHGPREWWQAGRISFLSHNAYTSFPFLSEMLSLLAMVVDADPWSGAISGKATLGAFSFLSVVAAYAIATRRFGRRAGLLAALILISTPWLTRISIIAYAESAITFYLIATVMLMLRLSDSGQQISQHQLVGVIGFLAGSAMASKYPGIVSVVFPAGCFVIWSLWKRPFAPNSDEAVVSHPPHDSGAGLKSNKVLLVSTVGIYCVGVCLAVGPWLIRNVADTGNPVYPLVWSVFGGTDWDQSLDQKWKAAHSAPDHNVSAIPAHLIDVALKNDWQNGLLFALAIPAIVMLWKRRDVRWMAMHAGWLLASWWLLTHRIDRFWVPLIPVMAVLASGAWVASGSQIWRRFLLLVVGISCAFHYGFCRMDVIGFHVGLTELNAASKQVVRDDLRYLNAALPDGARILMVGEAEVFDCRFETIYNTVFDESLFQRWTCAEDDVLAGTTASANLPMKSMDEIHARLVSEGVTHVYVNWFEILRYRLTYGYTQYVVPSRLKVLVAEQVLLPGNVTAAGTWATLSEQQQTEILSWDGHDFLMQSDGTWTGRVVYRVNRKFTD